MPTPPLRLKVLCALVNAVVVACGVRNVFFPATPLPFIPDDDKFIAHFFPARLKTTLKAPSSDEHARTAFVFQLFGVFMLATAAQKVLCVFGNRRTIGGLALRKKQFLVFGAVDVLLAWVVTQYRGIAFDVIGPFGFLHMLEGITFIGDALFGSTAVSASKEMKKASKSWDDVREAMARDSAQKEKSRRD